MLATSQSGTMTRRAHRVIGLTAQTETLPTFQVAVQFGIIAGMSDAGATERIIAVSTKIAIEDAAFGDLFKAPPLPDEWMARRKSDRLPGQLPRTTQAPWLRRPTRAERSLVVRLLAFVKGMRTNLRKS